MRYTTATAIDAMMGMSAIHAAPVGPNNTPGRDDRGGRLNRPLGGIAIPPEEAITVPSFQNQKREASFQRTNPGNTYENMPGFATVEPNAIQQKRENLQNVATIDHNAIAFLHNNGIAQKREASPNGGDDNHISGHLATDPSYLRMDGVVGTKRESRGRDIKDTSQELRGETPVDSDLRLAGIKKETSKSIHQTRDASSQIFAESAADQTLRHLGFEKVHSKSLHQAREAGP
ncbi:hypothetical protein CFE70_003122 [Pyrenophora teres f. teres 0-1]|uniref:Uncharacterized protein n=2 Tax=Pyrenophora teres f. teres TaxID=97479 RepID=E3S284_PYRTT|nr:hypothetical protein PTT_16394 [Pyrenophora teres f. teres 0-1]KAE8846406.1 hypothetical protein HRS9139_00973 [Pyrenophora teres f. teres]KAE8848547.1 hypothetical protein PTNB85_02390 [Pyrenophora teres f. teres]KAE8868471.1 hypothetical protein PTNB29_02382 [Pyrenophora teres f. teres]KAE8873237.1 hypothetical protein PTNB73_02388 [Pyrenophora teres f. teres]